MTFVLPAAVRAQEADPDEVLLTVVSIETPSTARSFTRADLDRLPQHDITTKTPWTEGESTYSGPSLSDVLALADIPGEALNLVAIDDYAVQVPRSSLLPEIPVLADRLNGKPFGVAEKGPLWVMYPFNVPEFQTEVYYGRSAWQLSRIEVGAQ